MGQALLGRSAAAGKAQSLRPLHMLPMLNSNIAAVLALSMTHTLAPPHLHAALCTAPAGSTR